MCASIGLRWPGGGSQPSSTSDCKALRPKHSSTSLPHTPGSSVIPRPLAFGPLHLCRRFVSLASDLQPLQVDERGELSAAAAAAPGLS